MPSTADSARDRQARRRMVDEHLAARGIDDVAVLTAMRTVRRHEFVPDAQRAVAYADHPLPIGFGATISQPYIVALMTQALSLQPGDRVLEVGTGSGYAAAVLAEVAERVVTIESIPSLAASAHTRLGEYGDRVIVIEGDGSLGAPAHAPFDAISVTAAAAAVPPPLLDQLAVGGRLVMPVGKRVERLLLVRRTADGFERRRLGLVRFVPLTGEYGAG